MELFLDGLKTKIYGVNLFNDQNNYKPLLSLSRRTSSLNRKPWVAVGLINKKTMSENVEKIMCNTNSNDELRKLCEKNSKFENELKKSLNQPKQLL